MPVHTGECIFACTQGGHSPGKRGKVREFQSGQGICKSQGKLKSVSSYSPTTTDKSTDITGS